MDISLDFVVDAARRRMATLTPEVAGYVVLMAARELELRPRNISAESLALAEGGEVHVREAAPASAGEVESALRGVLATLVALAPSPAPAISAVAERTDRIGLGAFAAELAAALIPINHAAAHRALARLYRESQRARVSGLADEGAARLPLVPSAERQREAEPLEIDVDLGSYPPTAAASLLISDEPVVLAERANAPTPQPNERFPEPFALATQQDDPAPVAVVQEPFALAAIEDDPAPVAVVQEPFALAAIEDAASPVGVVLEPFALAAIDETRPPNITFETVQASAGPPSNPSELDALVTGAPESPTPRQVVVPVPIIELTTRERGMVVPMATIEAAAPRLHVPVPGATEPAAATERTPVEPLLVEPLLVEALLVEPRLVEPRQSIDTLSQNGFARVSWPSLPPANEDLDIEDCRSDVEQLLAVFIADARSEQRMTRGLRRMLGLEPTSNEAAPTPLR